MFESSDPMCFMTKWLNNFMMKGEDVAPIIKMDTGYFYSSKPMKTGNTQFAFLFFTTQICMG